MRTLLALILLASSATARNRSAIGAPPAACGPVNVAFAVKQDQPLRISEPESGKALIYVIQDHRNVTIRVGLDGAWIGANQGNSHFSLSVAPGEHHLCANWQSKLAEYSSLYSLANFTAEPGKTYYFRTRVWISETTLFFDLDPLNSDEGRYLAASTLLAVSHPKN
jgi:hypothetical protein